jgi:hypothetical protein
MSNQAMKLPRLLGVLSAGIIFLSAGLLQAQLIDVDFNSTSIEGRGSSPTMSGAAVLGAAGDQWNGINATSGSGISLNNADGSASAVTMTFTSGGSHELANLSTNYSPFASTPYNTLMQDYIYETNIFADDTITLSGLASNTKYNLVLYCAADNAAAGYTTFFNVNNGNGQNSTWNGTSST